MASKPEKLVTFFQRNKSIKLTGVSLVVVSLLTACFGPPESATSADTVANFKRDNGHIDGLTVSYLQTGVENNSQPIIFIHGTPGSAVDVWADILGSAPSDEHYLAIDRFGFGESGPDGAVIDLELHAKSVLPLLEKLNGRKPILVGHSYGGPVVVQAALDNPDAYAGIIVAAGALDPGLEEIHFMQHVGDTWPISAMLPRAIKNANHELMTLKGELEELQPRLGDLKIPTVIVHGTEDDLVPYANVDFMQKHFPEGVILDVIKLEGQNHFLPWNSIPALHEAIDILRQNQTDQDQSA